MACKNYKIEEQSGGKWLIERQQIDIPDGMWYCKLDVQSGF